MADSPKHLPADADAAEPEIVVRDEATSREVGTFRIETFYDERKSEHVILTHDLSPEARAGFAEIERYRAEAERFRAEGLVRVAQEQTRQEAERTRQVEAAGRQAEREAAEKTSRAREITAQAQETTKQSVHRIVRVFIAAVLLAFGVYGMMTSNPEATAIGGLLGTVMVAAVGADLYGQRRPLQPSKKDDAQSD